MELDIALPSFNLVFMLRYAVEMIAKVQSGEPQKIFNLVLLYRHYDLLELLFLA